MFLVDVQDGGRDFASAFGDLQAVVVKGCARESEKAAKIVAGIRGALDFAAANPDAARALIIDAHSAQRGDAGDYRQMVEFFGRLLGNVALPDEPCLDPLHEALVGSIAGIVGDHVRTGRQDRLPEIAPELIQLTLLPYVGFDEAKRGRITPRATQKRAPDPLGASSCSNSRSGMHLSRLIQPVET